MARAIWKGNISFGLISIPVELQAAVRDHRPRFRLLHARDLSPIRYDHVCEREGRAVSWDDLVKGYEYDKGRYVVLTRDDFQAAALEKTRTIDILDFVPAPDIDDRYFVTPYYVLPGKGGERAYALLREALRDSGRMGIAKIILRDAQHLLALSAVRDALVLDMMRYADELIDPSEYRFPPQDVVRAKDLQMARRIIEGLSAPFAPAKYTDEYRENLLRIVQAKIKGKRPALKALGAGTKGGEIADLMERLRLSLAGEAPAGDSAPPAETGRKVTRRKVAAQDRTAARKGGARK